MRFAAHLAYAPGRRGAQRKAATIEAYVSAVRAHFAAMGGFPLSSNMPRWRRFVRGLRRLFSGDRRPRHGLRGSHLRQAFGATAAQVADRRRRSLHTVHEANAHALLTTGYLGLMRPRELSTLTRADLSFEVVPEPHAVIALLPLKKKPGQSKVPVILAAATGDGADAYDALRFMVAVDQVPPAAAATTPLFRRGGLLRLPFSPEHIAGEVRAAGRAAGLPDAHALGGQSLRIGGATDLHAAGVPPATIQLLGRWSSDIFRVYTRTCVGQVLDASRRMHAASGASLEERFPGYVQSGSI